MPSDLTYSYLIQSRSIELDGNPLAYDVVVMCHEHDKIVIHAVVDWQDGMLIFQTEDVEPSEWMRIAEQLDLGMREVRRKIGDMWDGWEFDGEFG